MPSSAVVAVAATWPFWTASTVMPGRPFSVPSTTPLWPPPPCVKSNQTVPARPSPAGADLAVWALDGMMSGLTPTIGISTGCPAWAGCLVTTAPFSAATGDWSPSRGRASG
ncbi:hypothetical protein ACFQQB_34805 [Nonomuraea rubra]|uniref:hypothetical protein n=1 Tax=Nonomuraea rubra TaxID=46180 RepID=UPI00361F9E1A